MTKEETALSTLDELRRIREGVLVERDNATNPIVEALAGFTLKLYDKAIARAERKHGLRNG